MDSNISPKTMINQMFMLDFRKWKNDDETQPKSLTKLNKVIKKFLIDKQFGGVILFRENIVDVEQTIYLIDEIKKCSLDNMLIGIDQEGGIVNRIKYASTTPGNMLLGATNDSSNAYESSKIIARELSLLGFNINFAPTVDLNTRSDNSVIGVRSFGDNPKKVTEMSKMFIKGMRKEGIIPCIKHFPGHGDTNVDSHYALPTITSIKDIYESTHIYPFREIISNNIEMIMTGHIALPVFDRQMVYSHKSNSYINVPATLSKIMITNYLRKSLNYKGIVISDALTMHALSHHFNTYDIIIRAIYAGVNILLMPYQIESEKDILKFNIILDKIFNKYSEDPLFASRVKESYELIKSLKESFAYNANDTNKKSILNRIIIADNEIHSKKHSKKEIEIASSGITCLKDSGIIPFRLTNSTQHFIIYDTCTDRLKVIRDYIQEVSRISENNFMCQTYKYKLTDSLTDIKSSSFPRNAIFFIVSENIQNNDHFASKLTRYASSKSYKFINIISNLPYDIRYLKESKDCYCLYGTTRHDSNSEVISDLKVNLIAFLKILFSIKPKFRGVLPVDIF